MIGLTVLLNISLLIRLAIISKFSDICFFIKMPTELYISVVCSGENMTVNKLIP